METIAPTEARSRFFELLSHSLLKNKQYRIPYKSGSAVLISEEEYESLLETIELLSAPGFKKAFQKSRKEIQQGKTLPFEKVFSKA